MKFRSIALSLFLVVLAVLSTPPALAAGGATLKDMPLNPEYVDFMDRQSLNLLSPESCSGVVPGPLDLKSVSPNVPLGDGSGVAFPARYDLRELGRLTPVRDQRNCGSCWLFAAYASLESRMLQIGSYAPSGDPWDFSENHMKNNRLNRDSDPTTIECCYGGWNTEPIGYLASWRGAVSEDMDPYNTADCISPTGLPAVAHMQNVYIVPARRTPLDNNEVKSLIMNFGAVYSSLHFERYCHFNEYYHGYYYDGHTAGDPAGTGHAIALVGWDDNFPAEYCRRLPDHPLPPGNGAFIARNHGGVGWRGGEEGYFYISYYDANNARSGDVTAYLAEPAFNYGQIYQYDEYGRSSGMGYGSTIGWFANVFTAGPNCVLDAVSFYTFEPGVKYEVYAYQNPSAGTPISTNNPPGPGGPLYASGYLAYNGYHTVTLDSPMAIPAGSRFSVVVKIMAQKHTATIPFEQITNYSTAHAGESYVSPDGINWTDLYPTYTTRNVCLKAFTRYQECVRVSPANPADCVGGPVGGPFLDASNTYTILNDSERDTSWSASISHDWLSLSAVEGELGPHESADLVVTVNANAYSLPEGSYVGTVDIYEGATNYHTTRIVRLIVKDPQLVVTGGTLCSDGPLGGPFTPTSSTCVLENAGYAPLNWTVSKTQPWLDVSSTSGTLQPRQSTTVTLAINSIPQSYPGGDYSDTVTLTNTTNSAGNTTRTATLAIGHHQHVKLTGSDSNDGYTWDTAKRTIGGALSVSPVHRKEVRVGAGTYPERITINCGTVLLGGFMAEGICPDYRDWRAFPSVIDGCHAGTVVTVTSDCAVDGFTICNGSATNGAGICADLTSCGNDYLTVANCSLRNNAATDTGGAMYLKETSLRMVNTEIIDNIAGRAAGLYFNVGRPSITNCTVAKNTAVEGGGCWFGEHSDSVFRNNIVAFNSDGLFIEYGRSGVSVTNCDVYGNQLANYAGMADPTGTNGNISADPRFHDATEQDYRVLGCSPCVDAGANSDVPSYDLDKGFRLLDGDGDGMATCDMGAYEYAVPDVWRMAMKVENGGHVNIGPLPVTATLSADSEHGDWWVYVERFDKAAGVRVRTSQWFEPGCIVKVAGTMQTDPDTGERFIEPDEGYPSLVQGSYKMGTLGMRNQWLGGGNEGYLPWIKDGFGFHNTGLLVQIWGRVTYVNSGGAYFMVDDGSDVREVDYAWPSGVRVVVPYGEELPPVGSYVTVKGISSVVHAGNSYVRVVKTRDSKDIKAITSWDTAGIALIPGRWNYVALPGVPQNPAPDWVFRSCPGQPGIWLDWYLKRYDARYQNWESYWSCGSDMFGGCLMGEGYGLYVPTGGSDCYSYPRFALTGDQMLSLPRGSEDATTFSLVGNPFGVPIPCSKIRVTDGTNTASLANAVTMGWIHHVRYWTGTSWQDVPSLSSQTMQVGGAYQVFPRISNLAIICTQ